MPRPLIVRLVVPAAAVLSLVGQPAWAGGPACWNQDELPAAQLHAFNTTLMVGAMRCRSDSPDALASYNAFAESRKSSIEAARTVLQARFIRDMGPETGVTAFKNFDTEIANRVSLAGQDGLPCEGIDTYSRFAASASEADLYALARLNNRGVDIRRCEAEATVSVVSGPGLKTSEVRVPEEAVIKTTAAPDAAPAVAVATSAAVDEQPDSAKPPEMQAASQAQAAGSEQPAVETAAAAEGSADTDPAKALEDAARALVAAATSLRTASAAR